MRRRAPKSKSVSSRRLEAACRDRVDEGSEGMKTVSRIVLAASLIGSVALTGCAYNSSSPDVYTASQAQREETVRMATVESVRGVKISSNNGQPTGLGAIGGGALGGVAAGSAIGGGNGSIIAGIIGGLAGAVAGNAVENSVSTK